MTIFFCLLGMIVSCLIIWRASDGFETASNYLGRNLSEGVRGATINAIGSSMPELLTTLFFLMVLDDTAGFAGGIGTTAGSAIFNSMIIPALVILAVIGWGVARSVEVSKKVVLRDGIALIVAELIFLWLITGTELYWWHGLILILMYGIYVFYMLATMRRNKTPNAALQEKELYVPKAGSFSRAILTLDLERLLIYKTLQRSNAIALLVASTVVIGASCLVLVYACELLGESLHIPVYFIAVILASAATSVPDTVLSIKDARRGNYDDAVSNALGSNIFDICFALGFPLLLYIVFFNNGQAISMDTATVDNVGELRMLLLIMTVVAFFVYYIGRTMGTIKGIILFGLYLIFTIYIIGRALENELAGVIGEWLRWVVEWIQFF